MYGCKPIHGPVCYTSERVGGYSLATQHPPMGVLPCTRLIAHTQKQAASSSDGSGEGWLIGPLGFRYLGRVQCAGQTMCSSFLTPSQLFLLYIHTLTWLGVRNMQAGIQSGGGDLMTRKTILCTKESRGRGKRKQQHPRGPDTGMRHRHRLAPEKTEV